MAERSGGRTPAHSRPGTVPDWLLRALVVGAAALLSYSVVALGAATLGAFRPVVVLPLTAVATAGSSWAALRELGAQRATPLAHVLAGVALVGALAWTAWNGAHHGEQLIAERDPGVYAATGLWLADHGNLEVVGLEGPFRTNANLRSTGMGFHPNGDGTLQPQFVHLTATFLGGAGWVGDAKVFLVNPVLAGAGLVVLYALGSRLGSPIGALAGTALFAFCYPLLHVSRLTYSEPLALLLFFTGLLVLSLAVERRGLALGVLGGGLLGAVCMARVDGYVPLIPVAAWLAASTRLSRRAEDRAWRVTAAAAGAMVATATFGTLEGRWFSEAYYSSDLGPRLPSMVGLGVVLSAAMWFLAPVLWRQDEDGRDRPTPLLGRAMAGLGALVVLFLSWARWLRPDFDALRERIAEDLQTNQLGKEAWTTSYLWLEWYLGPVLVAAGFAGLIWLVWRGLRDPRRGISLALAGGALAVTVLYLVRPSITPDQPWAMRRFLTVSIPALCLAAGLGLARVARLRPRPLAVGAVVVAGAVSAVAVHSASQPFYGEQVGHPLAERFNQICAVAHEEPSAILIAPERLLYATMPQTLQAWCDVPVAGATDFITASDVVSLDRAWEREGRRLLVLATSERGVRDVTGPGVMLPEIILMAPDRRVDGPPEDLAPDRRMTQSWEGDLTFYVLDVLPGWPPRDDVETGDGPAAGEG